ncbi:hypothetical protein [Actinoplanes sp. GCM10030250]|uniref:hypothetical protein n=1 Tax=Actinoplanes sp. GCM10030250 TaxID=3273376 RepID=UPI003610A764
MTHADLTLAAWLDLSDDAAGRVAAVIAAGAGASLAGIAAHEYHGRRGRTAFFDRDGIRFALVPGGTARAGYDASRFVPTDRQAADFAKAAAEWGIDVPLGEYVDRVTSPAREVVLPALLVAVRAEPAESLVSDDSGDDYDWMVAGLASRGLRPPAPDEWEYACGAGATTLFRWGDDYPEGEPYGDVPLLKAPNLFGLVIGDDPYNSEFTTDPEVLCGGDGGSALCGGSGDFLSWLSLATAFREPELAETVAEGELTVETPVRPVVPVP